MTKYITDNNLKINKLSTWSPAGADPLIIAGPCSAETEKQVLSIAEALLENSSTHIFRAGIWKARTHPDSFSGIGKSALKWLKRVKEEMHFPVCTEVMNVKHVNEALDNGIDILWIGARTTVNPFIIEEIANELKGTQATVLIKNPLSPDINLWLGAIERINRAGIKNIAAIHRGFSSFYKTQYRNEPFWEIPIQLKCKIPDLPILCDPSHISGNRNYIYDITSRAYKLGLDGLMIEVHNHPDKALSDSKQQVTPNELSKLLKSIVHYKYTMDSCCSDNEDIVRLQELRTLIDTLDESIISILHNRLSIVSEIDIIKNRLNMSALQPERWREMLLERISYGKDLGISDDLINDIMNIIHQASLKIQK